MEADSSNRSSFDVAIYGTGLVESIVAGALARIGKSVLHIDSTDYYGETSATVLSDFFTDAGKRERFSIDVTESSWLPIDGSTVRGFYFDLNPKLLFSRSTFVDYLNKSNTSRYVQFKPLDRLFMCCKQFLIEKNKKGGSIFRPVPSSRSDVFSNKDINVLEKRILMRFLTFCAEYNAESSRYAIVIKHHKERKPDQDSEEPEDNPSKSQSTPQVNVEEWSGKSFGEFLKNVFKIKGRLFEYIVYCIALACGDEIDLPRDGNLFYDYVNLRTETGIELVQRYLFSVGRFGVVNNAAMLCPMYGSGEIPQAFCRMSAVFGSVYMLNSKIKDIHLKDKMSGDGMKKRVVRGFDVELNGNERMSFECAHLLCSNEAKLNLQRDCAVLSSDDENCLKAYSRHRKHFVHRCIVVSDQSITGDDELSLSSVVPGTFGNQFTIMIQQTGEKVGAVPDGCGRTIVHFSTKASADGENARQCLESCVKEIFCSSSGASTPTSTRGAQQECEDGNLVLGKPTALFCAYFSIDDYSDTVEACLGATNFTGGRPCDYTVDYENAIEEAKVTYKKVLESLGFDSDEGIPEFIPQVPDVEEVQYDSDVEENVKDDAGARDLENEEDAGLSNNAETQVDSSSSYNAPLSE